MVSHNPYELEIHVRTNLDGQMIIHGIGIASQNLPAVQVTTDSEENLLIPWTNILKVRQGKAVHKEEFLNRFSKDMFPVEIQCGKENPNSQSLQAAACP